MHDEAVSQESAEETETGPILEAIAYIPNRLWSSRLARLPRLNRSASSSATGCGMAG